MKLARVAWPEGAASWAVVDAQAATVRRVRAPFADWAAVVAQPGEAFLDLAPQTVSLSQVRLLPPLDPSARVFGVGLNYLSHLTRLGRKEPPAHTLAYIKPASALVAPDGEIRYPAVTRQLDFEIELVAVIGRPLGDVARASEALMGYTIGNDISARDAGKQLGSLDLFTQKAQDRTAPVGPWITTLDEAGGPGQPALDVHLSVNGETRQHDNTRHMIFGIDELLNYVDARIELQPGDLVFTGSTCGVGLEDGRFLQPGDRIEASIERLGVLRNSVGPQRVLAPARAVGRLGIPS